MLARKLFAATAVYAALGGCNSPSATLAGDDCRRSVIAAKAEWLALTQGQQVAPSQRVRTSDGRVYTGSALNWAHVLLSRAESACAAAQVEVAASNIREVHLIFHAERL